jgi:hypothetical protein
MLKPAGNDKSHGCGFFPPPPFARPSPADALTFSFAAVLCLATTLLGTLVTALRAIRVDPAAVMRAE